METVEAAKAKEAIGTEVFEAKQPITLTTKEELVSAFSEFFETRCKKQLLEIATNWPQRRSFALDFGELSCFNPELADKLITQPSFCIQAAEEAVKSMSLPTSDGSEFTPHVRPHNLPENLAVNVQDIGSQHLDRLLRIEGVVNWVAEIKPFVKVATWECIHCQASLTTKSERGAFVQPDVCRCGRRNFRLLEQQSTFVNIQRAQIQDPVEKLRGAMPTTQIELWLEDDLVNIAAPGERIVVTGIPRLRPVREGRTRSAVYAKYLEALHVARVEREFEEIEITKEDEQQIIELSKRPDLCELIVKSIAPSIYGHKELKEAIALQLFGGTPGKILPDGQRLRADTHLLLVGDPGCLVADERIVLGNGAITKIGELGERHLQDLNQQVLTGQGYRRAVATRFHIYRHQPILEILTESGKSIKGTFNHPLLVVNGMRREWRQLKDIRPGDRVAVVTWIPCTITAPVKTGWFMQPKRFGPRPRVRLPQVLNARVAAFLGYVLGDGWVRRDRIAFNVAPAEKDLLPKLLTIVRKEFGCQPNIHEVKRQNRQPIFVVELHSVDIASNLRFLRDKRVPALIMRSGNKVVAEFLAWLFEADGCVFCKGRGRRAVQLKSASIELLRDVQLLLLRFGIHSRIVERNLVIRRARDIIKFAKVIGFKSSKKRHRLRTLVAECKRLVQAQPPFGHTRGKSLSEKVVYVGLAGVADVYDIEVPNGHRFVANGIISHNTAKTSICEFVSQLAPKCVFVSGGGASGVGLTVSAEKESDTEGWVLKAGAMVLANGGLAIIDEFDKMREEDRGLIHDAMERQVISVAKAGIVAHFHARTAILASANPKLGRFDPHTPVAQQFDISPALLSRFDLIFTIRDVLNEEQDRAMAAHILKAHRFAAEQRAPTEAERVILPAINLELLRKYIAYARRHVAPKLSDDAERRIGEFFVELRRLGAKQGQVFPITARQIEGIIRLAEASAKMRLSPIVELQDAERAIALINYVLREVFVDKETGRIDVDVVYLGQSRTKLDRIRTLLNIITDLEHTVDIVSVEDVLREAAKYGIDAAQAQRLIEELRLQGELYEPKPGFLKVSKKTW